MPTKRVILLEFNELSHHLLDAWMAEGKLTNFERFYRDSEVFTTESDEKHPPYLEPWIQWYSVHTGLSYKQHGVFHLTDGPKANHRDVWQVLRERGFRVANCSSMNCKAFESPGSFFLPDPWCTTEKPYPPELNAFYKVVATKVQEHTNQKDSLTKGDYLRFTGFLSSHGLRPATVKAILKQLLNETVARDSISWKRVTLLDKLQFDVFRYYWRLLRPDLSTFFLNSTAHYQHAYWRHMAPETFTIRSEHADIERYKDAILFGYQEMDRMLADFFKLEKEGALLILATALGQQPPLKKETIGRQRFYRPRDAKGFLRDLNIFPDRLLPVMTHQYVACFGNLGKVEEARAKLESVTLDGKPVFGFDESEPHSIYFDNRIQTIVPEHAILELAGGKRVRFYDIFYKIDTLKSGCHHTEGVLWMKTGKHRVHEEKVSILDIYPTVVSYFGIDEALDRRVHYGRSLIARTEMASSGRC